MIAILLLQDTEPATDIVSLIGGGIVFALLGAIYFTPALIARNKHPQAESIALLNFFLGWTLIGWVAALVWATSKPTPKPVAVVAANSVADELTKLKQLVDAGAITQQEYDQQKAKLLK